MTITYNIYGFPAFPIKSQLFHVPGAAVDGGLTSGGARIMSPEPGGMAVLEVEPSLITSEWTYPLASWLMSKTNGEILRFRLAPTPQVASSRSLAPFPWGEEGIYPEAPWSNEEFWAGDVPATFGAVALAGTNIVVIDLSDIGQILQPGHVIGHKYASYLIDEISYSSGGVATMRVKPPIRSTIAIDDPVFFRSWFTGTISNPDQFRAPYDAGNVGNITLGNIILSEVILP